MDTSAAPEATPSPAPGDTVTISLSRLTDLENTNREYGVTINTLGIVVEKLLKLQGGEDTLYVEPEDRLNAPDVRAGALPGGRLWIKVSR